MFQGENSKKIKVPGSDRDTHRSTQFSMLIPNMIFLLHKNQVLIEIIENYESNADFSTHFLENATTKNNLKKSDTYYCCASNGDSNGV